MADVFLSYSKQDRSIVQRLSAVLEAEGYSVWWDNALVGGESFRADISAQINTARAVIVVWSKNSVRSDWVRAEAAKALADGKLIPVKTSDLSYTELPLPFDQLHIEAVDQPEQVLAALRLMLARSEQTEPTQLPSPSDVAKRIWQRIVGSSGAQPARPGEKAARKAIFICYRRQDSAYAACFLHHVLSSEFPNVDFFLDVDAIEPGADFREAVARAVSACEVLIAFVGKEWLTCVDDDGKPRIASENDLVRLELGAALERNIRVIPVLIDGSRMPKAAQLPTDIRSFSYRNAVELRHTNFVHDASIITRALKPALN